MFTSYIVIGHMCIMEHNTFTADCVARTVSNCCNYTTRNLINGCLLRSNTIGCPMQTIGHNIMSETYGASIVSDDRDVLYHTPFEVFLTFRIPVFNPA